jgi:hypothetical protein
VVVIEAREKMRAKQYLRLAPKSWRCYLRVVVVVVVFL